MKKLLVRKLPVLHNLKKRNVRNTRGKQETELPSKPKSNAKDLKDKHLQPTTCTELNLKTTQSGGTKETVSGLELDAE